MLEHVTANQTRFVAPGLSPDPRGVALGRFCLVLLPSLDRVVGLLHGLSERSSLDDVLPQLRIVQVRTPLESSEFVVQIPTATSYDADAVSAISALMGGLTFTGSSKHFVKYRDGRSPLGYDVDSLHSGAGDFILYAPDFTQAYRKDRELPFARLALGLSLVRERLDRLGDGERALLRVVPGLWRAVLGYLHRNAVACEVAACERTPRPAATGSPPLGGATGADRVDPAGPPERFYLMRCELPSRMEELFRRTPGVELHRLRTERASVELGFRHPIELDSCSSVFEEGRFYLFSGSRDRLDVVTGGPTFVSAGALVELGPEAGPPRLADSSIASSAGADGFSIPLHLVSGVGQRRAAVASRIPREQAGWLKKLVFLLPPQVLSGTRVCITAEGIFLRSDTHLEHIPLGELFYAFAPQIYLPLGTELVPRVTPEVLVRHLGAGPGRILFFLEGQPPVLLAEEGFAPLGERALSSVALRRSEAEVPPSTEGTGPRGAGPGASPTLRNQPVGIFPLWGFREGGGKDRGPVGEGDG
jgi:hypothetical protein